MGTDSLKAAKKLKDAGCFRSCISRAYYAAFSRVTSELIKAAGPGAFGRYRHPRHHQIPRSMDAHLGRQLAEPDLKWLKAVIRRLYKARLDADYVSGAAVDEALARDMLRDAHVVFRVLGVRG